MSLAAAGFAGGVWSRRFRRGSSVARSGDFSRVPADEEEALLTSGQMEEQDPATYHHNEDELSQLLA
eukprot:CAMPEP_0115219038 /NCGR_PEP_ID=MMETSP0270-20121206/26706_1 /TAXON_ID=71861 /ORGANISM="Scrippsiella trochoidea, Strain CCMP3099" /LENGTH=66 /DNA_ID=CAMNT_0002633011 /DNA_START=1096 /DNA_END=1296 /DNA_ORIENTATION=-